MMNLMRRYIMRRRIVYIVILSIMLAPSFLYASWLDSWYSQKTSSGPSYYEGQQRGYWNAGSFSARVPVSMIYPISVTPPKFSAGCGGIDFFAGGVSLMSPDLLVKKLQGILASASGVAFDMALQVLCPVCSNVLKSLEAIANQLNATGLDSCKAGKALVNMAANDIKDSGVLSQQQSDSLQTYANANGLSSSYAGIMNQFTGTGDDTITGKMNKLWGTASPTDPSAGVGGCAGGVCDMVAGCPPQYKQIYTSKGSFLENVAGQVSIAAPGLTDIVRGIIGDFYIIADQGKIVPITPCPNNSNLSPLDDLVNGLTMAKGPNLTDGAGNQSTCYALANAQTPFKTQVYNSISAISTAMSQQGVMQPGDVSFVRTNALPLALILKSGVQQNNLALYQDQLSDITAKMYAYKFITDLSTTLQGMLNQADSITSQVNPDPGTNSPGTPICKPPAYIHGIAAHMQERLRYWQMDVQNEIAKVMQEYQTMQSIADTYKRQADTFNAQVASAFGKPVASRVAGRM